jgi:hypothetical protein
LWSSSCGLGRKMSRRLSSNFTPIYSPDASKRPGLPPAGVPSYPARVARTSMLDVRGR